jgi:peptidyl-tRNA hydrolase
MQVEAGTTTVCAIGPGLKGLVDSITKDLKLL